MLYIYIYIYICLFVSHVQITLNSSEPKPQPPPCLCVCLSNSNSSPSFVTVSKQVLELEKVFGSCSDIIHTEKSFRNLIKSNRNMVNIIWLRINLMRFRKDFSVCIMTSHENIVRMIVEMRHFTGSAMTMLYWSLK